MNSFTIMWPRGEDLRVVLVSQTPVSPSDILALVAPNQIFYAPQNGILECVPVEDPIDENSEGADDDANNASVADNNAGVEEEVHANGMADAAADDEVDVNEIADAVADDDANVMADAAADDDANEMAVAVADDDDQDMIFVTEV